MLTVLMATYNGERYLREQLDSLFAQTEQGFTLRVADDCSTDGTVAILDEYAARYPGRMTVTKNATNSGSAKANFLNLLLSCRDEYAMLSDQDDVWRPDKIAVTLAAMREAERAFGRETPVLVHTDLTVVDGALQTVHPSFMRMSRLDCRRTGLVDALVQNTVTGCTAMLNMALLDRFDRLPEYCIMHDWWAMLVAAAFGRIVPLEHEQTILYRQHGDNAVGAKDAASLLHLLGRSTNAREARATVDRMYRQAAAFLAAYGEALGAEQRAAVEAFSRIPEHGKLGRMYETVRLRAFKHGLPRVLGQLFYA